MDYKVFYADEHIGNELDGDRLAGWYWVRLYTDGTPNGMDGVGPFDTELEACDDAAEQAGPAATYKGVNRAE